MFTISLFRNLSIKSEVRFLNLLGSLYMRRQLKNLPETALKLMFIDYLSISAPYRQPISQFDIQSKYMKFLLKHS